MIYYAFLSGFCFNLALDNIGKDWLFFGIGLGLSILWLISAFHEKEKFIEELKDD